MGILEDDARRRQLINQQMSARNALDAASAASESAATRLGNATSKSQGGLLDSLSSVLSGIGQSIGNVGTGVTDMFGSTGASVRDLLTGNASTGKYAKEWKDYAKGALHGNSDMSDKEYYAKSGGKALDAASTLADVAVGLGTAGAGNGLGKALANNNSLINVAQGALSGVANSAIDNGEVNLNDMGKSALIGAVSAGAGNTISNKLAGANGAKSMIGKALESNVGKAALTGAASGATGAGLASALNGGDLGSVLSASMQGAGGGALGGATLASAMGLVNAGANKLSGKKQNTSYDAITEQTPETETQYKSQNIGDVESAIAEREKITKLNDLYEQRSQLLQDKYGTSDATAAKNVKKYGRTGENSSFNKAYENMGISNPAEVKTATTILSGQDGAITKLRDNILANTPDVNTSEALSQKSIESIAKKNGIDPKKLVDQVNEISAGLPSRLDGSLTGTDTANEAFKVQKILEEKASTLKNSSAQGAAEKSAALTEIANSLKDSINTASEKTTKQLIRDSGAIDDITNLFAGNQQMQDYLADSLTNARNYSDVRSIVADLVNLNQYADSISGKSNTFGANLHGDISANNIKKKGINAIANAVDSKLGISERVNNSSYNRQLNNIDNKIAELTGEQTTKQATKSSNSRILNELSNVASDVASVASKPVSVAKGAASIANTRNDSTIANIVNNLADRRIARDSGSQQAEFYGNRQDAKLANEEYQNAKNDYENAENLYNSVLQQSQSYSSSNALTQAQDQLTNISNAMQSALSAGDFTSYATLAELYDTAYGLYEKQAAIYGNSTSGSDNAEKLTENQSKALTGLQQLETLEQMTPGTSTFLASTPLSGLVNLFGGDEYTNQAKSLALTLGYLQSGANVTPREAAEIGQSYIPNATDSEENRRQKLERARQLLNNRLSGTQYYQS